MLAYFNHTTQNDYNSWEYFTTNNLVFLNGVRRIYILSDLKQAVSLIKAGKKAQARRLLLGILKDNPDDEKAWLCMISCAANSRQFNTSVRNVLRINPQNRTALRLAQEHQIAVNVGAETSSNSPSDDQVYDNQDYDYLEPTQVASPTQTLKRDVISDALSDVTEILSSDYLADEETVLFEPEEAIIEAKVVSDKKSTSRSGILWLQIIAIAAMSIMGVIIVFVVLSAQNNDDQRIADETATSHFATGNAVSSTNESLLVAENSRATQFFATETLFVATDVALQATLDAPTPTTGPTDTPLPERPLVDYIQTINTAIQIRGDPIQYENRTVFRPSENVYVLVEVEREAPPMFVEVRITQSSDDSFESISQTLRIVPDNSDQPAVFTFQSDNEWPVGDYVAQVFVQDNAGIQVEFSIASP